MKACVYGVVLDPSYRISHVAGLPQCLLLSTQQKTRKNHAPSLRPLQDQGQHQDTAHSQGQSPDKGQDQSPNLAQEVIGHPPDQGQEGKQDHHHGHVVVLEHALVLEAKADHVSTIRQGQDQIQGLEHMFGLDLDSVAELGRGRDLSADVQARRVT